ncbi:MAG: hypothetical protein CVU78_07085 [Elusimicrobia bacterium HGW-Elusimicrobia-2]|nr:MAG: hypothetical protein CVU78_07085 [Elusimicrobia bacterium HGW-Elusimicrobia-2]
MKILYVVSDLASGGAQIALGRFLKVIDREKFHPSVIALSGGGEQADYIRALGIEVQAFDMRGFFAPLKAFRGFLSAVKKIDPDIIHGWMYHGNAAALFAAAACGGKALIWSIRCSDFDLSKYGLMTKLAFFINRKFSSTPVKVIYNSNAGKKYHEANGFSPEKSTVIQNGLDTEYFSPAPEKKKEYRKKYGLDAGVKLIGMASRYDPMKDFDTLFAAFAAVRSIDPATELILCGKGITKDNAALSATAQKYGIEKGLILAGHIEAMNEFYPMLDLFVLSSKSEGFPNVLAEAAACAVPAISLACGDAEDIAGAENILPQADTRALAEKMVKTLQMGKEETAIGAAKSVCRIREKFDAKASAVKFEQIYNGIAKCCQ